MTQQIPPQLKCRRLLANVVSRLFGTTWLGILVLFSLYQSRVFDLSIKNLVQLWIVFVFFIFLPFTFLVWQLKTGRITDLDIPDRQDRIPLYGVSLLSWSTGLLLIGLVDGDHLLSYLRIYYLLLGVMVLTMLFYKASVHVAVNASVLVTGLWLWGWPAFLYLPVMILVAWSRLEKRVHSVDQLLVGGAIGLLTTSIGFWLR